MSVESEGSVVNHVGQCVADLDRARRFYVEALGFEVWREITAPDSPTDRLLRLSAPIGLTACYLRLGGFVLELLHYGGAGAAALTARERPFNEPGLTHLSVCVENIGETCQRVTRHGGQVLEETNIGAAVTVRDPDGQIIELLPMSYRNRISP